MPNDRSILRAHLVARVSFQSTSDRRQLHPPTLGLRDGQPGQVPRLALAEFETKAAIATENVNVKYTPHPGR